MAATTMAIVVLIPDRLGRRLKTLQRQLDPEGQGSLPPHIPLAALFQAQPSFLSLEQHCGQVCHRTAPFRVELGALVADDDEGIVFAEISSGRDRLSALRDELLTGKYAPPLDDAPYEPRAVVAPLAYRDDFALAQWEEIAAKTGLAFYLERIDLMAQYPDGAWYERDFYTLDRAVTTA